MEASGVEQRCKDYFNGFEELYYGRTVSKVIIAIGKIVSYCLLIPPAVVCFIRYKNKKFVALEESLNKKFDAKITERIRILTTPVSPTRDAAPASVMVASSPPTVFATPVYPQIELKEVEEKTTKAKVEPKPQSDQKPLIDYLVKKIGSIKESQKMHAEQEQQILRFQEGVRELSFEAQKDFFAALIVENLLEKALKHVPTDLEMLNFCCGKNYWGNKPSNDKNSNLILDFISKCEGLKKLHLDFQGAGLVTEVVPQILEQRIKNPRITYKHLGTHVFNASWTRGIIDDMSVAVKTFVTLRKLLIKDRSLEYKIEFINFTKTTRGETIFTIWPSVARTTDDATPIPVKIDQYLNAPEPAAIPESAKDVVEPPLTTPATTTPPTAPHAST